MPRAADKGRSAGDLFWFRFRARRQTVEKWPAENTGKPPIPFSAVHFSPARLRIGLDLFFESWLHSRPCPQNPSFRERQSQPRATHHFIRSVEWSLP